MEYSVFLNREDASKVEEEELNAFIRGVISEIGIDLEEIWPEGENLDAKSKLKLRKLLSSYDIDIIHDGDRGYKIYFEDAIVGEWFKPRFVIKKDPRARRLSDRLFYEMMVKYSSPFENEDEYIEEDEYE